MNKIVFLMSLILSITFSCTYAAETSITFLDSEILIDDSEITTTEGAKVFLQNIIESHPDVAEENKNIENKVVTITQGGTYRISGTAEDTQIRVTIPKTEEISLILDSANITCKTAPAILIETAKDDKIAGAANVKLILENKNIINGSHVAEYYDEAGTKFKNDAAISSKVSLLIEGDGSLRVNADNEGIESKMHLTINSGIIEIFAGDDSLNASEDGVSYITINGGSIYGIVQGDGSEGDGMDSNGHIVINDGFVVAQAHSKSQDSGLDADLGIIINGGTVIATGNMYEGIDETSKQQFMQMYFSKSQTSEDLIVITDENKLPIIAFKPINNFNILECSSSEFKNGIYYAFLGGNIVGTEKDGVYTNITSYEQGKQLSHTGAMENNSRPSFGGMDERPDMFNMENIDLTGITLPEGITEEQIKDILKQVIEKNFANKGDRNFNPEDNMMQNNRKPENFETQNRSYEFVLSEKEHVYRGVEATNIKNETSNDMIDDIITEDTSNPIYPIIVISIVAIIAFGAGILTIKNKK